MNRLPGALALCLPALPFVLLCFQRGFLRRLGMFPRALLVFACGIAGYLVLALLAAWWRPEWLPWLLALVAPPAFYLLFWRARPQYGTGRGLPPGSLQIAPPGPWRDYLFYLKQAERYGPAFKMSHFVRPMVCLHGIRRGNDFLKQHEDSTVTPPMPFNRHVPRGFMRYMPPELHLEYRSRMKVIFSDRRALDRAAPAQEQVIRSHLAAMAEEPAGTNPVAAIEEMTFALLAELFAGVTMHDPEFGRFRSLYREIDYRRSGFTRRSEIERRLGDIENIFLARIGAAPSFFDAFLGPPAPDRIGRASDRTLTRNFIYLLMTSSIDVADLLVWILKKLCDDPRWLETLHGHLSAADSASLQQARDLAQRIVLETLRLEQSEYLMRKAIRDLDFEGFRIPRGWLVRIGVRESHRDGTLFARPHEFDPDRFVAQQHGARNYSPFGMQQKSCLGQGLTLALAERFVLELGRAYRCAAVRDGARELGAFHWRPSSRFRVRLIPYSG